jgi:hypothetical protein
MGPDAAAAAPDLIQTLTHTDSRLLAETMKALRRLGVEPAVAEACKPLAQAAKNPCRFRAAVEFLGSLGPRATEALPVLGKLHARCSARTDPRDPDLSEYRKLGKAVELALRRITGRLP